MLAGRLVAVSALLGGLFFAGAGEAQADELLLVNGFSLRGRVDERGDQLVVHTAHGRVWVAKSQVKQRIVRETDGEVFARRRAELLDAETPDLDGRVGLAKWAIGRGLRTAGTRELKAVLAVDPDHAGARQALGYVRHDGAWVTADEQKRLIGLIQHRDGGEWITAEEADLRRKQRADAEAARTAAAERERIAAETRKLQAEARRAEAEALRAERLAQDAHGRWYRTVIQHSGQHYRVYTRATRAAPAPVSRAACGRRMPAPRPAGVLPADAHTRARTAHQHPADPHTRLRTGHHDPHDPHTRQRTPHRCGAGRTAAPLFSVNFGTLSFGHRR